MKKQTSLDIPDIKKEYYAYSGKCTHILAKYISRLDIFISLHGIN